MTAEKTIAIIGASANPAKWSHKAVMTYLQAGWKVFPVNPFEREVAGLQTYPSVRDIPLDRLDRVSVYLPPRRGLAVLEDIASKQVGELFINPGAESDELVCKAQGLGLEPILACSILAVRRNEGMAGQGNATTVPDKKNAAGS